VERCANALLKDAMEIQTASAKIKAKEPVEFFGGEDTRKIFANEYWDDRAVRMPGGEGEDV
jgi:hypothetical protein